MPAFAGMTRKGEEYQLSKSYHWGELGDVVTVTQIDRLARRPSTCLPSSSASWTPRRNAAHSQSCGPAPAPAPARLTIAVLGGLADAERDLARTRIAGDRAGRRSVATAWAARRNSPPFPVPPRFGDQTFAGKLMIGTAARWPATPACNDTGATGGGGGIRGCR